jgi:hypothetical protein
MGKMVGCLLLILLLVASEASAVSLWAGIWHKTKADGSQVDCLDVGPNNDAPSLEGMTFSVSGPGLSYTFTPADFGKDAFGHNTEMYKEFPSLAPGHYTFTMDDGQGQISKVVDTHVAAPSLPRVDPATIQLQRRADGSYRFTWAPVNDTQTYYYRLVLANAQGEAIYYSARIPGTEDSPVWNDEFYQAHNTFQDGVTYQAWVEVHDAPSFSMVTNRSSSPVVSFTPQPSDYHPDRMAVDYAAVYNRFENDGTLSTDLSLGYTSLAGVTSVYVTGPGNVRYDYDLSADRDPVWPELYKKVTPPAPAGLYTFHVVANGQQEQRAYANLSAPVSYPVPAVSTYQAEAQPDGNVRFSWSDVDHTGALYYRVFIQDSLTGQYQLSSRVNRTFIDLPPASFAGLANPEWRVEVCDSPSFTTQRNRRVGAFTPLQVRPYDPSVPVLSAGFTHFTNFDNQDGTNIYLYSSVASGQIAQMRVDGPNGYSRDVFTPVGFIDFLEPVTPAPGLYTVTVADVTGTSTRRYYYQTAPRTVAPVDFRTVNVNDEGFGWVSLSWAPVASDIPLWYAVEFYYQADQNGDGLLDTIDLPMNYYNQGASVWIPLSALPAAPVMFRIFAFDGSNGSVNNNYSRSVMVGYGGPGFNYAALTDGDGDGFASNVDSDDASATVNPFPYPVITGFSLAASSDSLTVPITTINFSTKKFAAGCFSETNSSANCSWSAVRPASYTFSGPGTRTLYAFIKDASGNISAAASAQTVITLPAPLALSFTGTGTGGVTGGMTCSAGASCPAGIFSPGTVVTLNPAAGFDSIFTGWSGDCAVSGQSCLVTMNGPRSVSANFVTAPPAWLMPGTAASSYFTSLTNAYGAAVGTATIEVKAQVFTEDLVLNRAVALTLRGGYNAGYLSSVGGYSTLLGKLSVRQGSLAVSGLKLR